MCVLCFVFYCSSAVTRASLNTRCPTPLDPKTNKKQAHARPARQARRAQPDERERVRGRRQHLCHAALAGERQGGAAGAAVHERAAARVPPAGPALVSSAQARVRFVCTACVRVRVGNGDGGRAAGTRALSAAAAAAAALLTTSAAPPQCTHTNTHTPPQKNKKKQKKVDDAAGRHGARRDHRRGQPRRLPARRQLLGRAVRARRRQGRRARL